MFDAPDAGPRSARDGDNGRVTAALVVGIGMFAIGFVLRVWHWRPFADAYAKRHSAAPPRSWLWTPSDDAAIERRRRLAAIGTALLWIGAIVAILNPT